MSQESITAVQAELELSTYCPFDCAHCYISSDALKLHNSSVFDNVDYCDDLLKYLAQSGVNKFVLTGGEPTVHKNFFYILDYIAELGASTTVFTNGILGAGFWRLNSAKK